MPVWSVSTCLIAVQILTTPLGAEHQATPDRSVTITASPSILPKGTWCMISVFPEDKGKAARRRYSESDITLYQGKILRAEAGGILLSAIVSKPGPIAQRVPRVPQGLRNAHPVAASAVAVEELWIPVERICTIVVEQNPVVSTPPRSVVSTPSSTDKPRE